MRLKIEANRSMSYHAEIRPESIAELLRIQQMLADLNIDSHGYIGTSDGWREFTVVETSMGEVTKVIEWVKDTESDAWWPRATSLAEISFSHCPAPRQ